MRLKTKQYAKLAVTSLIAAFSFGLTISCVSNHKQNINKVFAADDVSTTWSYNPDNKALTCTSASNYPNGFIMETNQVSVTGLGGGQYEIAYNVLGYPSNSVQPDYTDYGTFTLVFISGSYNSTASTDGPYGSITAYPLDVSGLDSDTEYEINLKVEPTGDMNEQSSAEDYYWVFDDTTGYYRDDNHGLEARPDYIFIIEDEELISVDFAVYDLSGAPNDNVSVSFSYASGSYIDPASSSSSSTSYTFTGYICVSDGSTLPTVTLEKDHVGVLVSGYKNAEWELNMDISMHQKSLDSQRFSYMAVPVSLQYDSENSYVRVVTNVSIYDNTLQQDVIYPYEHPEFLYESATCSPVSGSYQVSGNCWNCGLEIEEFAVSTNTASYSDGMDLSEYFNSTGTPELESIQITIGGEPVNYIPVELGNSVELGVILTPSGATASLQWEDPNETGFYTITQTGEYTVRIDGVELGDASIRVRAINTEISQTIGLYINQPTQEYIVKFNGNEATSGSMSDDIFTTDIQSSYPYILPDCGFSRDGYTFAGWGTTDGASPEWQPTDTANIQPGETTFYAIWELEEQVITYTITYNPNRGQGEPFTRSTNPVEGDVVDVTYTFEGKPDDFINGNLRFEGWSTDEAAIEAEYTPSESYTINENKVVYAVWVDDSQTSDDYSYEILFVANDGTDNTQTITFTAPSETTMYELPSITDIGFERVNYTFVGWSSESDGEVISGNPEIETGLSTFYAIWEYNDTPVTEEYTYEVVFYANGGSGSMEPDSFTKTTETFEYSLPQTCDFTYPDHEFIGWSLTSDGEIISGATVISSGKTSFYAIWEEDTFSFNVVFNANGGSGTMEPDSFTKTTNTFEYSLPQTCGFTYPDHEFIGWSLTSNGDIISGATVISSGTTTFYAIWRLNYSYIVTFDGNGATSGSTESVVLSGDSYSQTIVFPECGYEREGYIFKGWGFNSEAIMTYKPGEERNDITADTTFYAIWTQLFTISFDANGGTGTMEDVTVPQGTATMPECGFTREGYTFAGWAVGSPDGVVYQPGDSVSVSANYVLYATWDLISPVEEIKITVEVPEVTLYVDDTYTVRYTVTPVDASVELVWSVEDESVAKVIEDGMVVGLSVGTTSVTISDANGTASASFIVHVIEKAPAVQPENPISPETIENISNAIDTMDLSEEQTEKIQNVISENQEYISEEAGDIIYQALLGTTISSDDPEVAEAQKELVVTVVETGVAVDAGKATSISDAQEIDKALPENANFSVEGEIEEFYQRQMVELFGGQLPSKRITRADTPSYEINTDTQGKEGQEAVNYLANEQALYENMVDFVDTGVGHMGKAALKLRVCSGESVTVQVKSYVTVVKVSSFREFDQETADKEFVEAVYKAILLSMQNEVISILEKEHKPSNNAEKEAQYKQELEAVKDYETFEIMVTEVLRQKYVALTGEQIDDVEDFQPIYWEIFTAWALDKPSPYPITLEELTQTTIEQSTNRARTFTIESNLSAAEWGFIAGVAGGAFLIIGAAAVVPNLLKKRKEKEGAK